MKYKTVILIFAVLTLSACAQAVKSARIAEATPTADQMQTESVTKPEAIENIEAKCIRNSDETRLLINIVQGYCLQYPAEYDIAFPSETEIMLVNRSMLNVSEPNLHIKVQHAGGMTIGQAADQLVADYVLPSMEVSRRSLVIGEEQAIMLDGLSGQEINRQVVVLHNDQLYHLTFAPMDESLPEVYTQAEVLYNIVIQSFNFRTDTNLCPDCLSPSDVVNDQPQGSSQTAMISGWVWHDQCDSGKDGQPAPVFTPEGCVKDDSPLGPYHADGELSTNEPLIEGVMVTLGEGKCPSTGVAEMSTIITDLSYSFSGLKAGTYCISIDPQREPNLSILRPGVWTYPTITQDVISTTVILTAGEYKGMVNFGWDYQFKP